jgi:hypothetical protein
MAGSAKEFQQAFDRAQQQQSQGMQFTSGTYSIM